MTYTPVCSPRVGSLSSLHGVPPDSPLHCSWLHPIERSLGGISQCPAALDVVRAQHPKAWQGCIPRWGWKALALAWAWR